MSSEQIPSFNRIRSGEPAVVVDNLTVRYGDVVAVDRVDFHAWPGEVTAVLGPNGAGKTSTIEVCEGLRRATSGTVRVLGFDPIRDRRQLRPVMGVMLQDGGIYPSARPIDAVRQYCGLYGSGRRAKVEAEELLVRVGLQDRRRTSWRRLSGGERQRLSLAMALAAQPRVLFLDEPTSGVDVHGRTMIREVIRSLASEGTTVVLATHELDEADKVADRIAIFHQGTVRLEGPLDTVRRARRTVHLRTARPITWDTLPPDLLTWLKEESPGTYTMEDAPTDLVATLAVWLNEHGIDIIELRTGVQTLEEVFKNVTGDIT